MMRVAMLTSVHPSDDVRIFYREACTLARAGYEVFLLNAYDAGERQGVRLVRVPTGSGRMARAACWKRYAQAALRLEPDVLHFHDPELLPAALWARSRRPGLRLIYDSHEDLPRQMRDKAWLPAALRLPAAKGADMAERWAAKRLDLVIGATEEVAQRFRAAGGQAAAVRNYPILSEFPRRDGIKRERAVCYVGSLTESRGVLELARAAARARAPLYLAGTFDDADFRRQVLGEGRGWARYLGVLDREGVSSLMARCGLGAVTLHPTPAYVRAIPVKLLEYMAAGLPVIASDFPFWRELLAGIDCAAYVNPRDTDQMARVIREVLDDPERAGAMGRAGRRAAEERFCWESEQNRLLNAYRRLERKG